MATGVSRYPDIATMLPTLTYEYRKRDRQVQNLEREQEGLKRKRSFPMLLCGLNFIERGSDPYREQRYYPQRVNSFRPPEHPPPYHSLTLSPIEGVSLTLTSTSTHPHLASRTPVPKPPPLAIPFWDGSGAPTEFINPPTPEVIKVTTRDCIKALVLGNQQLQKPHKAPSVYTRNPAIFADGVPTFSTSQSSSTSDPCASANDDMVAVGSSARSNTRVINGSPGSSEPHIPTQPTPTPPSSKFDMGITLPDSIIGSGMKARSESSHTGVGGHPTRGVEPEAARVHGRRPPPPPIILPRYKHTKTVLSHSPQTPDERHSHKINTARPIPSITVNTVNTTRLSARSRIIAALPSVVDDVLSVPAPGDENVVTLRALESRCSQTIPPNAGNTARQPKTPLPHFSENDPCSPRAIAVAQRRMRGPQDSHRQLVGASMPQSSRSVANALQPSSHSRKKGHGTSSSIKGLEKRSSMAKNKNMSGTSKGISKVQKEVQKQRLLLTPLNTSLNVVGTPDPWVKEDQERSAADSKPFEFRDEMRSHETHSSPDSGSLIGSGYTTVISNHPFMFQGNEKFAAKSKYGDLWEEMDFREVISQLKDMKAFPMP